MNIHPAPVFHAGFGGLIGVARWDITPPLGIYSRMWGASRHDVSDGFHRPLTGTALVIQARSESLFVLIGFDLGWWRNPKDERFVREGLIQELDLDPARVMLNLAHTHAGPSLCREDSSQPGGDLIANYLKSLRNSVIAGVREALRTRTAATLDWSHGKCDLARNRDLADPDQSRIVCGFNPTITADDTLLVGRVTNGTGHVLATIVNYACHPVTLAWENRKLSPDFPGAMREIVEQHTGGAPCLFLQGASGELAPRRQYTGDTKVADANGRQLGFAALGILEGMLPPHSRLEFSGVTESGAPLGTWTETPHVSNQSAAAIFSEIEIPLKELPSVADLDRQLQACSDRGMAERLRRMRNVRLTVGDGQTARIPFWAWRIGDALWIGHPNEAYSYLQMELRRRLYPQTVVVMNLVNGSCGYLPPSEFYDRDIYQVWQTPFERGCLEKITDGCAEALTKLHCSAKESPT